MERSTKYISREKEMKMQRKTKRKGNEDEDKEDEEVIQRLKKANLLKRVGCT